MLLWIVASAFAAPDAATLAALWERDHDALDVLIELQGKDFDVLAKGDPLTRRADTADGAFAVGAIWVEAPVEAAWIAIQDGRDRPLTNRTRLEWLDGSTRDLKRVYFVLDLPWPVADRQWVSEFRPNPALAAATDNRVWERMWSLGAQAHATTPDPAAVWVDVNQGAWTLIAGEGGTLCVVSIRSVVGGNIPDGVAQAWATTALSTSLQALADMSPGVAAHYGADHHVIFGPDGSALPPGLRR